MEKQYKHVLINFFYKNINIFTVLNFSQINNIFLKIKIICIKKNFIFFNRYLYIYLFILIIYETSNLYTLYFCIYMNLKTDNHLYIMFKILFFLALYILISNYINFKFTFSKYFKLYISILLEDSSYSCKKDKISLGNKFFSKISSTRFYIYIDKFFFNLYYSLLLLF